VVRFAWSELSAVEPAQPSIASAAYPELPAGENPPRQPERARNPDPSTAAPATAARNPSTAAAPTAAATTPQPRTPTADAFAPSQPRAVSPERVAFAASARLRWFIDYASVGFGGDAGSDFGALRLRAEAVLSSRSDALGSAALGSAALCAGYRVLDARLGSFSLAGYPAVAFGITWMRGSTAVANVTVDPATGFYGDVRFLLESRMNTGGPSPTLSAEVGRAAGFVARAGDRVIAASGGFFIGASAGGRY